tara:strand:+ start:105 stop:518 length:414 start_codon:yes stop_codon:yes gene_type:complete
MEKYLYFRDAASLADDDDGTEGGIVYPLSRFKGMAMGRAAITGAITEDDDKFSLFFEPAGIGPSDGDIDAGDNDVDVIVFNLVTAFDNKPQEAMQAIIEKINQHPHSDGFITIFDKVTGQVPHASVDDIIVSRAANE